MTQLRSVHVGIWVPAMWSSRPVRPAGADAIEALTRQRIASSGGPQPFPSALSALFEN